MNNPRSYASITAEQLGTLPPGSVIEDRHRDQAQLGQGGLWHYFETGPLATAYVAKHYGPFVLIRMGSGDQEIALPASVPLHVPDKPASLIPELLPQVQDVADAWAIIRALREKFGLVGSDKQVN